MQSRLLKHLHNSNILCRKQYGFWMKQTTENVTYKLMNEILTALNNKLIVGGIFCDLEKAFNCVNHDKLISKLETYEITGIKNSINCTLKADMKEFNIQ
jgi:Reverse transcriptase (RNA-dependent DNA polymerase).